jgi:hypothetical protein
MYKIIFIFILLASTMSVCLGQKKYVEKAIEENKKNGYYYVVEIPDKKSYSKEAIASFCKENNYDCKNVETRRITEFGSYKTIVISFEFEDIEKISSKEECLTTLSKYPTDKQKIREVFFKYCKKNIQSNIGLFPDFIDVFGIGEENKELNSYFANALETNNYLSYSDVMAVINRLSSKLNGIDTKFDPKNEIDVERFVTQIQKDGTGVFTLNTIKLIQYWGLSQLPVITKTISADYEQREYSNSVYRENPDDIKKFISRFPNSNLVATAKKALSDLDSKKYNVAVLTNTVEGYNAYLKLFPTGSNAELAKKKISEIQYAAKVAKDLRDKLIREKGADYVVNKHCSSALGFFWGDYVKCNLEFADGTRGVICKVDYEWTLDPGTLSTKKILYETEEQVSKAAYAQSRGLSLPSDGRYYPKPTYSSSSGSSNSSGSSSGSYEIISGKPRVVRRDNDGLAAASIKIYDGGSILLASSDVCEKTYSVTYTTKLGERIIKKNPFQDDEDFSRVDFPVTVEVSYQSSDCAGKKYYDKVVINSGGFYDIHLNF